MSYCVNCGVELDATLKDCPLCNTPVINPRELKEAQKRTPFPVEKVPVEMVKRKDMGLLVSIVRGYSPLRGTYCTLGSS